MNRATIITAVLDAILNQTLKPDCLVVVDDGSTDNSVEVIHNWKLRTNPPFETKLIALPYNMGVSVARNIGFMQAQAKHRYVYFLDSDEMPFSNLLQEMTAVLNQYPDAIAVSTLRLKEKKLGTFKVALLEKDLKSSNPISITPLYSDKQLFCLSGCTETLFRSDIVRQLNGFNEARLVGEDWDFLSRLSLIHPGPRLIMSAPLIIPLESGLHLSEKGGYLHVLTQNAYTDEWFINDLVKKYPTLYLNYRHLLAYRWKYAGRGCLAGLRPVEARDCFRRSLTWDVNNKGALWHLILTLGFGWLFKILDKLGLHKQFLSNAKRISFAINSVSSMCRKLSKSCLIFKAR